jgi:hypothetical protein
MPSKKKSKPSFKVPEDLDSAPQAGWVYRSETTPTQAGTPASAPRKAAKAEAPPPPPKASKPPVSTPSNSSDQHSQSKSGETKSDSSLSSGILDLTAKTFSSGIATIGNALMLGAAILTAPIRIGLWVVGFRSRD